MEFCLQSCVHGYHVYGECWTVSLGEELTCQWEIGNVLDRYAVAVKKILVKQLATYQRKFLGYPVCFFALMVNILAAFLLFESSRFLAVLYLTPHTPHNWQTQSQQKEFY